MVAQQEHAMRECDSVILILHPTAGRAHESRTTVERTTWLRPACPLRTARPSWGLRVTLGVSCRALMVDITMLTFGTALYGFVRLCTIGLNDDHHPVKAARQ